jgi:hypothetical protein
MSVSDGSSRVVVVVRVFLLMVVPFCSAKASRYARQSVSVSSG